MFGFRYSFAYGVRCSSVLVSFCSHSNNDGGQTSCCTMPHGEMLDPGGFDFRLLCCAPNLNLSSQKQERVPGSSPAASGGANLSLSLHAHLLRAETIHYVADLARVRVAANECATSMKVHVKTWHPVGYWREFSFDVVCTNTCSRLECA